MSATVINIRDLRAAAPSGPVAKIDRSTTYGNPYRISRSVTREQAIEAFRAYWLAPEQQPLRERALADLAGKHLACWCAPLPCHGDVILSWLESAR